MVRVQHPRPIDCDVVAEGWNAKAGLRTAGRTQGVRRVGRQVAVRSDLGQHRRLRLEVILRVQEQFISWIRLEPHVVIAVILVGDVDHDSLCVLARLEQVEPIWAVNTG
jgi:hypothetical protein